MPRVEKIMTVLTLALTQTYLVFWLWIIPKNLLLKGVVLFIVIDVAVFSLIRVIRHFRKRNVDQHSKSRETLQAVFTGLVPVLFILVVFNQWFRTSMLETASLSGRDAAIGFLMSLGTDVNSSHQSLTPLMIASASGHRSTVELLLQHGANVSMKSVEGVTAISAATAHNNLEIVKVLKDAGELQ
jgi:hypothetical protein